MQGNQDKTNGIKQVGDNLVFGGHILHNEKILYDYF